ncbi:glycerol-3-phosphate phosphatase-like isoform X1 [Cimex lectularius]|uniref:4-nitrophenylphosphatase n=2 Tax=Cimex lectularius TaxID=79782 RepID=A0A8I6TJP2_CIMLE|nr:glycerol-3-phosphate phosphatase-like isoform X1 [Cimex lectularius]XP_014256457.1 glycerol-3-phosphate phosphatase-like isoform X1 [Cimex lectularius]
MLSQLSRRAARQTWRIDRDTFLNYRQPPHLLGYLSVVPRRTMVVKNFKTFSKKEKLEFLNSFDTVFSDCDGVLWLGSEVINKAPEVIKGFKEMGKRVFYLTNNSMKTPDSLSIKFQGMGFEAKKDEVLCTAMLTAQYLKMKGFNKTVYLLSSTAVKEAIEAVGISTIGHGPDIMPADIIEMKESVDIDPNVGAVVVGYDLHFSYLKLVKAAAYLSSPDVEFIATNMDPQFPIAGGRLIPGAGSFVTAVEMASGRSATVVGKPSTFAFEYVQKAFNMNPKRCLMIGDRCSTDIAFGKKTGMQTLLVLTGVQTMEHVLQFEKNKELDLVPDYYTSTIADLLEVLHMSNST